MSDVQNISTGLFTLSGILVGALLEFLRERFRFNREKENKKNQIDEENRKSFLSPLCYHIQKLLVFGLQYKRDNFKDYKESLCTIYDTNITSIEELLKNNMHILPAEMNHDLTFYTRSLQQLPQFLSLLQQESLAKFDKMAEEQKKEIYKRTQQKVDKIILKHNEITTIVFSSVYSFMESGTYSPKSSTLLEDKERELTEALKGIVNELMDELIDKSKQPQTMSKP